MGFQVTRGATSNEAWMQPPNRTHCGNVIGLLRAHDTGLHRGTICQNTTWRIDAQNDDGVQRNLQMQRNGVFNQSSSVAGVQFAASLIDRIGSLNQADPAGATARARDSELTRALHGALTQSVGSWRISGPQNNLVASFDFFVITGNFSS